MTVRPRERIEVVRRGRAELRAPALAPEAAVRAAIARSPFHARRIPDATRPLSALPVMEKGDLAGAYADPRLTPAALDAHVAGLTGPDPLLFGEYRVLTTGGTSGATAYVPFDRDSWLTVLAAYARIGISHGFPPRLPRVRIAQVTAGGPLHMTHRIATSNRSPAYVTRQFAVTSPVAEIAAGLQAFRPDVLSGYPTLIAALAEEQRAGRLEIAPRFVFCGSEQLTPALRGAIRAVWTEPFDVYATTETGGVLAIECEAHAGLHLREEICVVEVVDDEDRPVADGGAGTALLATTAANRTLPLVRYRIDDAVTVTSEPCACGRPGRRIVALRGRQEDALTLAGAGGAPVRVHPNLFEEPIEERPEVARYQVVHRPEAIAVSVVARAGDGPWTTELAAELERRLRGAGAAPPPVRVEVVAELTRPASVGGKLRLVRSER